jgi:hypothetical protein
VFFPIYPSLPRDDDLNRALRAAESAWRQKLGAWQAFGGDLLLGYEYRACLRLGAPDPAPPAPAVPAATRVAGAFRRICIDVRSHEILGRYGYHKVEPPYRLWVWQDQLQDAIDQLRLRIP